MGSAQGRLIRAAATAEAVGGGQAVTGTTQTITRHLDRPQLEVLVAHLAITTNALLGLLEDREPGTRERILAQIDDPATAAETLQKD